MPDRPLRRRKWLRFGVATCALALLATAAPGASAGGRGHDRDRAGRGDGREWNYAASGISLDQAVAMVQSQFGGRVVAASASHSRGRSGYRIRVLTEDGRVYTVFVDAETGSMSES